jgi:hypothetical protein
MSNTVDPNPGDNPRIRANKASGLRWAIGLVAVLVLGFAAWQVFGPDHRPTTDYPPGQTQSGGSYGAGQGGNQPAAIAPNQDTGASSAPGAPADSGTGAQ